MERHVADGGKFAGLQIESNWKGVRDNEASRAKFAKALVKVIRTFLSEQMKIELPVASQAGGATVK